MGDHDNETTGEKFTNKKDVEAFQEIERIREANGGSVDVKKVLDAAREPSSPLHCRFEWRDTVAGEKYRLLQAYRLLAAQRKFVMLTESAAVDGPTPKEGAFHTFREYLPTLTGEGVYKSREAIKRDPEARHRNVKAFVAELKAWITRTGDFSELDVIRDGVYELLCGEGYYDDYDDKVAAE